MKKLCSLVVCSALALLFAFDLKGQSAELTVKVYLEGLYNGAGGLAGSLSGSDSLSVDSIQINLAQTQAPFSVVICGMALLRNDGTASLNLPDQVVGQQYYLVLKHRNSIDTWSKSPVSFSTSTTYNFTTSQQFPEITTTLASAITSSTAQCGGVVMSDGGSAVTARGVCWSSSPKPTVALNTKTMDGTGTGSFTSGITGLQPGTTYYVRAYATNGVGTVYGQQFTFTSQSSFLTADIDGNIYDTILIGNRVWMKQNLRVTKYRNGEAITSGLSASSWQSTTSGAYVVYNNTSSNDSIYAKLYNWYAVADPRGLCPSGWHVPSDAEWQLLESVLGLPAAELNLTGSRGSAQNVGGKLKSISSLWTSPNTGAINSSGFTGLPGGYRLNTGFFSSIRNSAWWWSSTQFSAQNAWSRQLSYNSAGISRTSSVKATGFSVRCVRNILPAVNSLSVTDVTSTSATCGGDVTNVGGDSVTVRGVCWSTTPNPTVLLATKTNNGTGSGSFTSFITSLLPGTTYHVRAYATNGVGTAYGTESSFTTLDLPQVSTVSPMAITDTSAQCGGAVSSDGGSAVTARGVCWSTSPGPTTLLATKTVDGSGVGSFTSNLFGLQAVTTYYIRAYATNNVGTAYGQELIFSTLNFLVDIDGNVFDTVVIGAQIWMKENLKVSRYRNGDSIPTNLSNTQWQATTTGAYAIYNNVSANNSIYGKLYNWYAVADPRGLCPTGWHFPSDAEWQTLEAALGMLPGDLI